MELDGIFLDLYGTLTTGDRQAVETTCEQIVKDTVVKISGYDLSIVWGNKFFNALESCNGPDFLTLFDLEKKTLTDTMHGLDISIDPEPYCRMLVEYWQNPPLQPEVKDFLAHCPVPICVVSNADTADAAAALAGHDISLAGLVTSEDARSYKPHPRIFDLAFDKTGWRRDRVIHVGDSLHSDVGGAMAAGIRSGWLNRSHRIHDIGTHTPDHELQDLNDLIKLVAGEPATK